MAWFTAAILATPCLPSGELPSDRPCIVWEDICLFEASTIDEAFDKAERLGRDTYTEELGTISDEGPLYMKFIGVRKVTEVLNRPEDPLDCPPRNGSEVGFSKYTLQNREDLDKLIRGKSVLVVYENEFFSD